MKPKTIVILVLVVLVAIMLIQNSGLVEFRLLFWHVYGPLFFLVLGVFAVGLLIGYLAAKVDRRKKPKPAPVPETKPGSPTAP